MPPPIKNLIFSNVLLKRFEEDQRIDYKIGKQEGEKEEEKGRSGGKVEKKNHDCECEEDMLFVATTSNIAVTVAMFIDKEANIEEKQSRGETLSN